MQDHGVLVVIVRDLAGGGISSTVLLTVLNLYIVFLSVLEDKLLSYCLLNNSTFKRLIFLERRNQFQHFSNP